MKGRLLILVVILCAAACAWRLFTIYDNRFPLGRMWETPAVRPHEEIAPYLADGRVPWHGGEAEYRFAREEELVSPVSPGDQSAVNRGGELYATYCMQCHGEYHDGNGTVGQSFSPLPGDLMSKRIQTLPDGVMFQEISYGVPGGRQPALATTISIEDRWFIVAYIKSLGFSDAY